MADFHKDLKKAVAGITSPPFNFLRRITEPASSEVLDSVPDIIPNNAISSSSAPPLLVAPLETSATRDNILQAVKIRDRINDGSIVEGNSLASFDVLSELSEHGNESEKYEIPMDANYTLYNTIHEHATANSANVMQTKADIDWKHTLSPEAEESFRESLLELAQNDNLKPETNQTAYIIVGTLMVIMIGLTVILLLVYKLYRTQDNYDLAPREERRRVKVSVQKVADLEQGDIGGGDIDSNEEFEVVEFEPHVDKNSYRF